MKKFFSFIFRTFINTVIILFLLTLCFLAFIFLISITNGMEISDTFSYIQSFGEEISSTDLTIDNLNTNTSNISYNNIIIENNNNKFYYKQLDDNAKIIYNALENNIDGLKKNNHKINFSTKFNTLLNQAGGQHQLNQALQTAVDAFSYDHPDIFYIDFTKMSLLIKSISIGPKTTYSVSIEPKDTINYFCDGFSSEENVNEAIIKVENVRTNIINSLTNDSDYNKALKVHDLLVNSLKYDESYSNSNIRDIYGALINKNVVCEGYAKAFKYILDSIGIECILVSGTATNSSNETESHMWNYIKLDDTWYGVDVTWDDPIIIGGSSTRLRRDYFCKGFSVFDEDHFVSSKISDNGKSFSLPVLSYKNYK